MLAVVLPLAYAYYSSEVSEHTTLAGTRNEVLARTYANTLWPEFADFLLRRDMDIAQRQVHDLTAALDSRIREMSRGAPVIKIKVYNLDGLAIYSSVLREIGEDKSQNIGFLKARDGKLVNDLTHRGRMSATEGEILNADVVSSYIPIYAADAGKVSAVFELYSNVTETVARIENVTVRLIFALIGVFFALYLCLLAIISRADRILNRQYAALEENQLRLSAKTVELETEIRERHDVELALRASEEIAGAANRAKSDFLSSMSHELRTPMNSILGFTQLLGTEPGAPLSSRQQRFVVQIIKAGNHLLDLINQVLDLAKIEAGKLPMSLEAVSLASIVQEATPMVQHLAQQRLVTINRIDVADLQVIADYGRLKQVVLNLLSNAIKYNRAHGTVDIIAERQGVSVKISIVDTGIGIASQQLAELFQPFSRLGHDAGEIEGTGIGLTVSKRIVEAMSGTIGVDSTRDVGSVFWLTLPAAARSDGPVAPGADRTSATVPSAPTSAESTVPTDDKCILYVEDNPANLMLMEEIVNRLPGVRLLSAHTAELGIELAKRESPNLIIMDIHLPGMNGMDALARLRAHPDSADIPVIALTANAMTADIQRGLAAGFNGYHTKPIQVESFTRVLQDALSGAQHGDI